MAEYHFGEIPGEAVGTTYPSRVMAKDARVHQVTQQGIAGNRREGCASIVLSGGYETDEDYGHEIFYTGRGGQDPTNPRGPHIADQDIALSDNAALVRSEETGLPIRILRGAGHASEHAPEFGYRYDGLYKVVKYFPHVHEGDGLLRWMFHLVQLTSGEAAAHTPEENVAANKAAYVQHDLGSGARQDQGAVDFSFDPAVEIVIPAGKTDPETRVVISQRVVRDTRLTAVVKLMYGNSCQICGLRLAVKDGHYSEGAHIRPLGKPHHGPDTMGNVLCLCPNHHAAFDKGGLYLDDDLSAHDRSGATLGALILHGDHVVDINNIRYHRSQHGHEAVARS